MEVEEALEAPETGLPAETSPDQHSDSANQESHITIPSAPLDERTVEKAIYGILAQFLPQLQKTQGTLADLNENQRVLIESILQENAKFTESDALSNVSQIMDKVKLYQTKARNIKKAMYSIRDKSLNIQRRAQRLKQQRDKAAQQEEARRQKEMEREKQLIAKPAKKS